jgi:hypothetical protein
MGTKGKNKLEEGKKETESTMGSISVGITVPSFADNNTGMDEAYRLLLCYASCRAS